MLCQINLSIYSLLNFPEYLKLDHILNTAVSFGLDLFWIFKALLQEQILMFLDSKYML